MVYCRSQLQERVACQVDSLGDVIFTKYNVYIERRLILEVRNFFIVSYIQNNQISHLNVVIFYCLTLYTYVYVCVYIYIREYINFTDICL
jgi:hypothetical protein